LGEISERLQPRAGSISIMGRCHKAPRTLEQDYQMGSKVLGTGYNGSVKLATARRGSSNQSVAVKTFRLKGLKPKKKAQLQTEIEVFLAMDHPHVARLFDVYETDTALHLVMECVEGGELFDRVMDVKSFNEQQAADAARQMLLSLHYLHSHGMVHRDLKLENFLYDLQGSNHLKMIDFGFSKYTDEKTRMRTSCGTLAYVAPEVLKRSYTSQCDLWSMGVIVFILLSGHMPFHGESDAQIHDIKKGKYVFKQEYWGNISASAKEFTRSLLEVDPTRRLNSGTALEHKWITQNCAAQNLDIDVSVFDALRSWSAAPKMQRACMSMMAWTLTNKHHEKVRDYFLALDRDHDGTISPAELREAMRGSRLSVSEATFQEMFQVLEQSGGIEIHYSDFLAAMMSTRIDLDEDILSSTFQKFDLDSSGFITAADLRTILGDTFEGEKVEELVSEADDKKDGKIDYQEFSQYARAYHPGTLLLKSAGHSDAMAKVKDEAYVTVAEVEITRRPGNEAACCVLM